MPRRGRRAFCSDLRTQQGPGDDSRKDRTQVFMRTKMCKFYILGCCSRGAACQFAHDKEELVSEPDLARTKLCKMLISTGQCSDPQCRYAHSKEELRVVPGFNTVPQPSGAITQAAPEAAPAALQGQQPRQAEVQRAEAPGFPFSAHTAMLHMEQAAQAHAAEAVRLQAIAMCLQQAQSIQAASMPFATAAGAPRAGGPFGGDGPEGCGLAAQGQAFATCPALGLGCAEAAAGLQPVPGGAGYQGGAADHGMRSDAGPAAPASWLSGENPNLVVKNTFLSVADDACTPVPGRFPRVKTAAARLESLAADAGSDSEDFPAWAGQQAAAGARDDTACAGFPPREPMQINPLSLRSLSSNSLAHDALQEWESESHASLPPQGPCALGATAGPGGRPADAGCASPGLMPVGWSPEAMPTDAKAPPLARCLPPPACGGGGAPLQRSAPPGGQAAVACALRAHGSDGLQAPPAFEKRFQDTPLAPQRFLEAGGEAGGEHRARRVALAVGGRGAELGVEGTLLGSTSAAPLGTYRAGSLGGPALGESGLTVKNTFIDFSPQEPAASLRAVRTAAGRLDLMGQE